MAINKRRCKDKHDVFVCIYNSEAYYRSTPFCIQSSVDCMVYNHPNITFTSYCHTFLTNSVFQINCQVALYGIVIMWIIFFLQQKLSFKNQVFESVPFVLVHRGWCIVESVYSRHCLLIYINLKNPFFPRFIDRMLNHNINSVTFINLTLIYVHAMGQYLNSCMLIQIIVKI